ncbi:MAG: LD-carboxypeptidase [Lachnospiraceae bacterium]|nr:LD-carboxypeptidase [Lachnospiraceae bacterium]
MRYPGPLKAGGTIGVPAPSFGCTIEPYKSQFESAVRKLTTLGYNVLPGDNCFCDKGTGISNTPEKCAEELNRMYLSLETDVLISCGGGELMCEIVPMLDLEAVGNAEPKWFMGYSDNTNFTFLSATMADTAAVYGPNFPSYGMEEYHESLNDALELLTGKRISVHGYTKWERESLKSEDSPLAPWNVTEDTEYVYYPKELKGGVSFSGRLLGGCLDCLANLAGTRFDKVRDFNRKYGDDGIIWFLESCDLNPMAVRRTLWSLKNSGWFDCAKAFLIGRPYVYDMDIMGVDRHSAAVSMLEEFHVPVIMDLDIGHLPPQMPIITGAFADVSANGNDICIEYEFR